MTSNILSSPHVFGIQGFKEITARPGRYTSHQEDYVSKFRKLVRIWRMETAFLSSITEALNHHAFQQIVGMGDIVIPLIISELKKQPDLLVGAMSMITKADPVASSDRGNMVAMAAAWVEWYNRRK